MTKGDPTTRFWAGLFADVIERTIHLEEFPNNIAICDPISAGRGIRDLFDQLDFQQQVRVVANGLPLNARVSRSLSPDCREFLSMVQ